MTNTTSSLEPYSLGRDARGAISMLGLVFSMLLIGLLFYALGIGRTLLAQEGMQDASDAAGFASAVIHARGMNLIVYINWIMAALLAILIALRLLQTLFTVGTIVFTGLAVPTFGATLPIAGWCTTLTNVFDKAYDAAKPGVEALLRISHLAEQGVSMVVPAIATLGALGEAAESHPPANGAFALPARISLPVESDKFEVLCLRAGETAGDMALGPLGPQMRDAFSDAIGDLVEALGSYFCEGGKTAPPSYKRSVTKAYPELEGQDCKTDEECEQAALKNFEAKPRLSQTDPCPPGSACEARAARARAACEPHAGFAPDSYQYLQEHVEVVYRVEQNKVIEESRTIKDSEIVDAPTIPCINKPLEHFTTWSDWDPKLRLAGDKFVRPVCKGVAIGEYNLPQSGNSQPIHETHISHILSCTFNENHEEPLAEEGDALGGGEEGDLSEGEEGGDSEGGDNENMSPMRVEDGLVQGGEAFQIRTIAFGDGVGPGYFKDGVKLVFKGPPSDGTEQDPSVGQTIEGLSEEAMNFLAKISIAQSEYYFADVDPSDPATEEDWMWRVAWTARLRRFRLPSFAEIGAEQEGVQARSGRDDANREKFGGMQPPPSPESVCQSAMGDCGGFTDALPSLDNLVLH